MYDKLEEMAKRFQELTDLLADPSVQGQPARYTGLLREHGTLGKSVPRYLEWKRLQAQIAETEAMLQSEADEEMLALARSELESLQDASKGHVSWLEEQLVGRDELSAKDVIVEIRAGVGGDEAALFAADLFRMYSRYAEKNRWKTEMIGINGTELGGIKDVTFGIAGEDVYKALRYESGVHRVQRVPETEASGRIHTSTCTVAVLPEIEDVELDLRTEDIRIDRFAAGGPGGQHVNKTESAIRLTHLPTGTVVSCQDEKSQHKNLAKAMRVLRSRIYEEMRRKAEAERAEARRSQIGTGDRSEKIRTYNFPENRLTDHRINFKTHRLQDVLVGDLEEVVRALQDYEKSQRLGAR